MTDPDDVVAEVGRVRRQTRMSLAEGAWRYLAVWAVVFLGSFVSAFFPIAGWYWVIGVPAGYFGMWLMLRDLQPGVERRQTPYWITGIAIGVANTLASLLFEDEVVVVVVWVVLGLGFGFLAWFDRQPAAAGLFGALAAISAVSGVVVSDRFALYAVLALVFTVATGGVAAVLWLWARRP